MAADARAPEARPGRVRIRPATEADLPACRVLLLALAEHQRPWRVFEPREGFDREIMERYRAALGTDDARHLVAEADGRVVGMAHAKFHVPSQFSDEPSVEVSSVVVTPSHRGRGIGRALMAGIVGFAREREVERLDLHTFSGNEEALRFWEALGFTHRFVQLTAMAGDLEAALAEAPRARE